MKQVVPFLKVDKGLAAEARGVQLMKPMPDLAALLEKAKVKRIFGTRMRSFIKHADEVGIRDIVAQQFDAARRIVAAGLVPIVEPERGQGALGGRPAPRRAMGTDERRAVTSAAQRRSWWKLGTRRKVA